MPKGPSNPPPPPPAPPTISLGIGGLSVTVGPASNNLTFTGDGSDTVIGGDTNTLTLGNGGDWLGLHDKNTITINGGGMCLFVGLIGNGLAVLMCLPLLRVPEGSVIKPMALPLIFIIIAAVTGVVGSRILMNEDRPKGWMLFRVVGNVLCLMPLFVGCVLMHWFAAIRDLTFG